MLHKESYLESIADKRGAETMQHPGEHNVSFNESNTVPIEYARTMDKAYTFSRLSYSKCQEPSRA